MDIIHDKDAGTRLHPGIASKLLNTALAFDIESWQSHLASDLESNNDSARCRTGYQLNSIIEKSVCNSLTYVRKHIWSLQESKLFKVDRAMASTGQQEVAP